MKILWITNIMLPSICKELNLSIPAVGGWMFSSLKLLMHHSNHEYAVATVYSGMNLISKSIDGVTYYLLPLKGKSKTTYNPHLEKYWFDINTSFKPDVVHIHGSEFPHGLSFVKANGPKGVVVSIQGIISTYAGYYIAGIDYKEIKNCLTIRDFLKNDSILRGQQKFEKRGELEIQLLKSIHHIIGRTEWDKAHCWALNPEAQYHHCGEILRTSFYNNKWKYDNCEPHSIFVSQGNYPIKGLHMLLKAMPLILREYPDAKVYVAGNNIMEVPFYRLSGYAKYLKNLMKELHLDGKVSFTGLLDEQQMCERYLKSNVFVCPSSIENSPNSLGEAQLLGMPYVASFVGGVPEIVNWNSEVLYRFEEYEMLASKICKIFETNHFIDKADLSIYNGNSNCKDLLSIYSEIANS